MSTQDFSSNVIIGYGTDPAKITRYSTYQIQKSDLDDINKTDITLFQTVDIPTYDIAYNMVRCGVYMLDGVPGGANSIMIPVSVGDIKRTGNLENADDLWIVYPGYSIQLFESLNFATDASYSQILVNDTSGIACFAPSGSEFDNSSNYPGVRPIYKYGRTTTTDKYIVNKTSSVKIWFMNRYLDISGFSG
jgi:hypothetical protein